MAYGGGRQGGWAEKVREIRRYKLPDRTLKKWKVDCYIREITTKQNVGDVNAE